MAHAARQACGKAAARCEHAHWQAVTVKVTVGPSQATDKGGSVQVC
jgi:hypothetical protein